MLTASVGAAQTASPGSTNWWHELPNERFPAPAVPGLLRVQPDHSVTLASHEVNAPGLYSDANQVAGDGYAAGDYAEGKYSSDGYSRGGYGGGGYGRGGGLYGRREEPYCCDDPCPQQFNVFFGYDSWRGIQDDGWGNNGLHTGFNFGSRLGGFSEMTGIGFQMGGSVGVYNWNGTDWHLSRQDEATMQGFVTAGFFRRSSEESPWSAAVVQDWMLTSNFGVFAENPTLSQWRGQIGYALNEWYEIGIWGAVIGQGDSRDVVGFGATRWQPVQQINAFAHYKWEEGGADTWLFIGVPEHDRLSGEASLGDYTVGALAHCPLNNRFQLYALVSYMHPSASPGPPGSNDESWCFFTGLTFFPGRNARTATVHGHRWSPLMPLANNGYFLVDQDPTY